MRTLLLVLFSVVLGVALGFGIAVVQLRMTPWNPKFDEGGAAAVAASVPHSPEGTSKVEIDRTEYDFGAIDRDVGGSHAFTFTNSGNAPLKLTLSKTSSPGPRSRWRAA